MTAVVGVKGKSRGVGWNWSILIAAGALLVNVGVMGNGSSNDLQEMLFAIVVCPIVALVVLALGFRATGRRRAISLSALVLYAIVSWCLFRYSYQLHSTARWMLRSGEYKSRVLAQLRREDGQLQHVEWDGWGFAGNDTVVYLVFDPSDSLSVAAQSGNSGKFPGMPCEVSRIQRLEPQWYTVIFFTGAEWDRCQ
jgi:hypothetical protein